jgi:predicted small lipoprotein YifL
MIKLLLAVVFTVAACGGKQPTTSKPADQPTTTTEPAAPTAMAPEECTAKGGEVRGDIGDGKVACAEGEQDLGRVNLGIEGAVCCAAPAPAPTP